MLFQSLLLVTTGGTFDKVYGSGPGVRDMHIGPAAAPAILDRMNLRYVNYRHVEMLRKDSLDMTDDDRKAIADFCASCDFKKIIITHGTDTMHKTALAIHEAGAHAGRSIVLTGALLPACVKGSDAEFNLGLALGVCLEQWQGIKVVLNGGHDWDKFVKDASNFLRAAQAS